jgi:hypothetical protein
MRDQKRRHGGEDNRKRRTVLARKVTGVLHAPSLQEFGRGGAATHQSDEEWNGYDESPCEFDLPLSRWSRRCAKGRIIGKTTRSTTVGVTNPSERRYSHLSAGGGDIRMVTLFDPLPCAPFMLRRTHSRRSSKEKPEAPVLSACSCC